MKRLVPAAAGRLDGVGKRPQQYSRSKRFN